MRKTILQTGEYYHLYNRGVDKRKVFLSTSDYERFLLSMKEFNDQEAHGGIRLNYFRKKSEKTVRGLAPNSLGTKPLTEFVCYCLLDNHFHFLIKQSVDRGISEFMKRLLGGYTCYFNQKYKRSGSLFQGTFKAVHVADENYLWYLSAYIHGNPEIHKLGQAENYKWSSYGDYLSGRTNSFCHLKNDVLKEFSGISEYRDFVKETIANSSEVKEELKKLDDLL
ncbi:MAG: hypothetical protein AUJ11_00795 [Parcubacteria group bacterium CG1_02_44_65]|nr:MAG: hypothetical protein AUJ11_00795 [Parcubacteria group bacterium CG1_02_44_65]